MPSPRSQRKRSSTQSYSLLAFWFISYVCLAQDCEVKPEARVLVNEELVTVDATHFPKHHGAFPPEEGDAGQGGIGYYVLHREKSVLYVPNFLNETMSEELKAFCVSGERFVRSRIGGHGDGTSVEQHSLRTSESCPLVPAAMYLGSEQYRSLIQSDPVPPHIAKIAREVDVSWDIAQRASGIIGVNPNTVEPLQLVRYTTPDAEYQLHHDHGEFYGKSTEHRPWTMLIFLNDVVKGGHTAFPELGLEVVPRGGDALIWANTKDGKVDPDMVHMGKPPSSKGIEKYAVNVWFGGESFDRRAEQARW